MRDGSTRLVSVHLPSTIVDRLDRLAREGDTKGESRCTRSSVLRRALSRGIRAMERQAKRQQKT